MNLSFEFSPLLPNPALIALGGVALLVLAFSLYRRARGGWLRLLATAAVFLGLLNPIAREEVRTVLPDVGVVVTDLSQSQSFDGRQERAREATRLLKSSKLWL